MRVNKKTRAALQRRRNAYVPTGPNKTHRAHMPGSQNRRKGAAVNAGGRR